MVSSSSRTRAAAASTRHAWMYPPPPTPPLPPSRSKVAMRVIISIMVAGYVLVVLTFLQTYMEEFQSSAVALFPRSNSNSSSSSSRDNDEVELTNQTRRNLPPPFDHHGNGVVVFYSLSGSTSIAGETMIRKALFLDRPAQNGMRRIQACNHLENETFPLVERILMGEQQERQEEQQEPQQHQVLFLELSVNNGHNSDSSSRLGIMDLTSEFEHWRQVATLHNTSFFAFTILDNPVSWHVHQFNRLRDSKNAHFNKQAPPCGSFSSSSANSNKWCEKEKEYDAARDEQELLQFALSNDQCRMLIGRNDEVQQRDFNSRHASVTAKQCQSAYHGMMKHLDWIGTTETLQTTTLPLLSSLLHVPLSAVRNIVAQQQQSSSSSSKGHLSVENLTAATVQALQEKSAVDLELYQRASRDYILPAGFLPDVSDNVDDTDTLVLVDDESNNHQYGIDEETVEDSIDDIIFEDGNDMTLRQDQNDFVTSLEQLKMIQ